NRVPWLVAAAAMIVAVVAFGLHLTAPVSFTSGDRLEGKEGKRGICTPADRGEVGAGLATDGTRELPLVFSDGTKVILRRDSRRRVERVSRAGAHLLLERGTIRANVVHRVVTDWRFVAGPFEARVTGTELDVAWDPVKEHFELGVASGAVIVHGP